MLCNTIHLWRTMKLYNSRRWHSHSQVLFKNNTTILTLYRMKTGLVTCGVAWQIVLCSRINCGISVIPYINDKEVKAATGLNVIRKVKTKMHVWTSYSSWKKETNEIQAIITFITIPIIGRYNVFPGTGAGHRSTSLQAENRVKYFFSISGNTKI